MIVVMAGVIIIHMASSSFTGVFITYIPQFIQLVILAYAMVYIRNSMR